MTEMNIFSSRKLYKARERALRRQCHGGCWNEKAAGGSVNEFESVNKFDALGAHRRAQQAVARIARNGTISTRSIYSVGLLRKPGRILYLEPNHLDAQVHRGH